MSTTRAGKFLVNLSLSVAVLATLFVAAELVTRATYRDEVGLFPRYHTDARYGEFTLRRIRPNSTFLHSSIDGKWKFITNSQGFRNTRDFEYEKAEGTIRVLSLGDSHTQGYEVRQDSTFSATAEKYLSVHGHSAEVMNAGVSGFSTAEALLFLENEGIRYKPDFVVLGFYANDFQDNIKAGFFKLKENGDLLTQKKEHIPGVRIQNIIYSLPLVKWMSENSYFYSLLFNSTWEFFKDRLSRKASDRVREYAIPTQEDFSDYQTALTSALLKRMYDFCRAHSVKFIIVDIPERTPEGFVKSSFPESLSHTMSGYCDGFISSESLLSDYSGVAETHRPHGLGHITEFTHTLLGAAIAKEIILLSELSPEESL